SGVARQQRNYSPVSPSLSPLPLFTNSASPTSNNTTLISPHTNTSTTATDGDSIHTRINLTSKSPQFSRSLPSPLPQQIRLNALKRFKEKLNKMLHCPTIAQLDARKLQISRPALIASDSYGLYNDVYDVYGGGYD